MKMTDGLFLRTAQDVGKSYAEFTIDQRVVDALCMELVMKPESFDCLLLPNLYGDIVSDLAAGLVGGLGVAPGANIGPDCAMFEAVHGSAPDIAGKGLANPIAMFGSFAMTLRYSFGMTKEADLLERAISDVLDQGLRTKDIAAPGQNAVSTTEMGDAVLKQVQKIAG